MKIALIQVLPFLNNSKDLDPSYKMDLDFWDYFERKKLCFISKEIQYVASTTVPADAESIIISFSSSDWNTVEKDIKPPCQSSEITYHTSTDITPVHEINECLSISVFYSHHSTTHGTHWTALSRY